MAVPVMDHENGLTKEHDTGVLVESGRAVRYRRIHHPQVITILMGAIKPSWLLYDIVLLTLINHRCQMSIPAFFGGDDTCTVDFCEEVF